jgi:hypothetical protein
MKRGMPETAEIFAVIAALAMAALLVAPQPGHVRVVVRRVLWARNWPAVALGALALIALLWGALATVSAKNYLDPGHRLDAATEQTVPSR